MTMPKTMDLLSKTIDTIESLAKWNGHLYNWYNIKTKEPLNPKYVSTVDSGNLAGYLYVTKAFLEEVANGFEFVWQPKKKQEKKRLNMYDIIK